MLSSTPVPTYYGQFREAVFRGEKYLYRDWRKESKAASKKYEKTLKKRR